MTTVADTLNQLQQILLERKHNNPPNQESYVNQLYQGGVDTIAKKVGEESTEVVMAAKDIEHGSSSNDVEQQHLINEVADLMFHTMVLLTYCDCTIEQVIAEINNRMGISGLTEKANRK